MTEEMEYLSKLHVINNANIKWIGKYKTTQSYVVDAVALSTDEIGRDDSQLVHIFHKQHMPWTKDVEYVVMLKIERGELTQMLNYQALLRG